MSIAAIDQVLKSAVAVGDVPNVTAVAADRDGVIYEGAAGPRAVGLDDLVGPDSMLRIASQTKIVATAAALQQVERGEIDLDAPVDTYLPEFADLQVLEGFDGDTPKLRPAGLRATVRHLITHTTGLGYPFYNADLARWHTVTGTPPMMSGLNAVFTAPLTYDPGTRFQYGTSTDWLGSVVEVVTGQPLQGYLDANIFGPLGMNDTTFLMTEEQRANSVPVHLRGTDGAWMVNGWVDWSQQPQWWAGGHGLYGTPRDFLAFQRMLLGGGTLGDVKILEPATVAAAFTNQIGSLDFPPEMPTADPASVSDSNFGPGLKWGYGLLLNTEQQPGMRAAGSGSWAGIFNTYYWVDPDSGITAAIYTQTLPFADPRALQLYMDFERALYASL